MITVNMHEAKTHLSRLVEQAAAGETVIIARAGTPLVRVSALEAPATPRRLGFLSGAYRIPDDFDRLGEEEIAALFGLPPGT
jgi:prevent-host-death family protein